MTLRAALLCTALLSGCSDDGSGGAYVYEPFNFTQAGIPIAATMTGFAIDAKSVPIGLFDIGTYSYAFSTQQWTKIDDASDGGILRLNNGDMLLWRPTATGGLQLRRRAGNATAFEQLPDLTPPMFGRVEVRSALIDRDGALYVSAVIDGQANEPLSIAMLPAGTTTWQMFPLALPGTDDIGEGSLVTDATGTTVLYQSYFPSSLYLFAKGPGASAFAAILTPQNAQIWGSHLIHRPGADPLLYDQKQFFRMHADGTADAAPGVLAPSYNPSGIPQFADNDKAYVLAAEGAFDDTWDIFAWDGDSWEVEHTINNDTRLRVAPNADLYFSNGLGPVGGRLHRP